MHQLEGAVRMVVCFWQGEREGGLPLYLFRCD